MANDGYAVAKELRKMNKDVDLAVNSSDFGMALPEWEDGNVTSVVDPYNVRSGEIRNAWNPPSWIRYFDFLNKVPRKHHLIAKIRSRIDLIRMMREYDIVETHVPYPIYSQFACIPYVVYDAGWIRYFPFSDDIRDKLARRGYRKARAVIITNPDTFEIADGLPYLRKQKIHFSPFAIDSDKYTPLNMKELRAKYAKEDDILLFSPSRQAWKEKGNDKMLRAYSRFIKLFPNSKFIMVAWSIDEDNSKQLANSLGISDKIVWIKPVPKNQLIQYYSAVDIVLDQFVVGSWGTSTPEVMSCGKPVLMYYKKDYIMRAFREEPPILNSFTEEEIYSNLVKLANDADLRNELGRESREWVIKTHSPRLVAHKHIEILESVL